VTTTYTDPVCGTEIEPGKEAATSLYQGETFYFCSMECMENFEKQPESYASAAEHKR
jgi:Cu+-exporting ATPase